MTPRKPRGLKLALLTGTAVSLSLAVVTALAQWSGQFSPASEAVMDAVNGSAAAVRVTSDGEYRHIVSNGLPGHATGSFPNQGNPNRISEQQHVFRIPLDPVPNGLLTPLNGLFGVALNGVPFDPGTAEFWNNDPRSGWHYQAMSGLIDLGLDHNHAHVQPDGTYHYHGVPEGLLVAVNADGHSPLIGYAADGFPIYARTGYADPDDPQSGTVTLVPSWQLRQGARPAGGPDGVHDGTFEEDFVFVAGLGDLDSCNGRFTVTPDYPEGTYAYFLTDTYPFVPRCFAGTPDESFARHGPGAGPGGGPGGDRPGGGAPRGGGPDGGGLPPPPPRRG